MPSHSVAIDTSATGTAHQDSPGLSNAFSAQICVARGDGIGPEIMDSVLNVMYASGAQIDVHIVEMGSQAVRQGFHGGISPLAWRVLKDRKVLLKSPTAGAQASVTGSNPNPTIRKSLGLFASVRPNTACYPYVPTRHPNMRVTIVRENEEDLYAGIEHRQTPDVSQCLRLISRSGSERVVRHAFEYARLNHRRKVTCLTKDSVLKMTDGLFREVFEAVAKDYPRIEHQHLLVDTGIARFVNDPQAFDVIVAPNVYGDIVSDIAAQMAGSLAFAPVANMGYYGAMFEAAHGPATDLAGKNVANPSGLLQAALMMLNYIGQGDVSLRIHNAWLRTLEDGVHTVDVKSEHPRALCVGTREFGQAIIERLGARARFLPVTTTLLPQLSGPQPLPALSPATSSKFLVGVDVFMQWQGARPDLLARRLRALPSDGLILTMISNRGLAVWPQGMHQTVYTDHWRCRFLATGGMIPNEAISKLLSAMAAARLEFIKTENLYDFGGVHGFTSEHRQ